MPIRLGRFEQPKHLTKEVEEKNYAKFVAEPFETGYGHTIGQPLGLGYVRNSAGVDKDFLLTGRYALDVAGTRLPAQISLAALYDRAGDRMRA